MELRIPQKHLLEAITWTHGITARRSSIPVLSNVLIEAGGANMVRMTTTDLNLWMEVRCPGQVITEGAITVHARTLYEIARSLPQEEVLVYSQEKNYRLTVSSGRAKYNLNGMPAEDFPQIPEIQSEQPFTIRTEVLNRMIAQTAYSISLDQTRTNISGAFFQGDGKIIRMVTTDRHRLSKAEFRLDEGEGMYNFGMQIPQRTIQELKRLVEKDIQEVTVGMGGQMVSFRAGLPIGENQVQEVTLVSKLVAEEFPPYERAIPTTAQRRAKLPRLAFLEAIRRVAIMAEDQTSTAKFSFKGNTVEIGTDNPNLGEGKDSVDIGYEGEPITLCFNAKYFIDVLSVLESDEVTIEMNEDEDAALLRDQSGASSFIGIIMPMKI